MRENKTQNSEKDLQEIETRQVVEETLHLTSPEREEKILYQRKMTFILHCIRRALSVYCTGQEVAKWIDLPFTRTLWIFCLFYILEFLKMV